MLLGNDKQYNRCSMRLAISRRSFLTGLAAVGAGALDCRASVLLGTSSRDGKPSQTLDSPILFENTIDGSKIDFVLNNSVSPQRYSIETMTGGVAVFDYNNDGLLDIFFTNGAEIPSLKKSNPGFYNRLFRNNGDGTFTDVTEKAGLEIGRAHV